MSTKRGVSQAGLGASSHRVAGESRGGGAAVIPCWCWQGRSLFSPGSSTKVTQTRAGGTQRGAPSRAGGLARHPAGWEHALLPQPHAVGSGEEGSRRPLGPRSFPKQGRGWFWRAAGDLQRGCPSRHGHVRPRCAGRVLSHAPRTPRSPPGTCSGAGARWLLPSPSHTWPGTCYERARGDPPSNLWHNITGDNNNNHPKPN